MYLKWSNKPKSSSEVSALGYLASMRATSFGAPECIRMSYATSDENIVEAIRRIKEALAKLK